MPYRLLGRDGQKYASEVPGTLGGYRPKKIYGKLDCRSASAPSPGAATSGIAGVLGGGAAILADLAKPRSAFATVAA
jgi:hypothetical protein